MEKFVIILLISMNSFVHSQEDILKVENKNRYSRYNSAFPISIQKNKIKLSYKSIPSLVLKEKEQTDLNDWLGKAFETDSSNKIKFEPIIIDLDEDDEDEIKICDGLTQGGSIIIDFTWTGSVKAKEIVSSLNLPYLDFDISISPFLGLLDKYLLYRNSTDVSIIFDSPDRVDQALYYWIDTTLLRMVISENLDKTTSNRLRSIRPIPNNFAILGSTTNLSNLFKTAIDENLVTLPQRWNLVFLDFKSKKFDRSSVNISTVNLLYLNEEVCCNILGLESSCQCPDDFRLDREMFFVMINYFKRIILGIQEQQLEFSQNLRCNGSQYNEGTKRAFDSLLMKELDDDPLLTMDLGAIILDANGTIEIGTNEPETINEVAKYNTKEGLILLEGQEIPPIIAFYRIGITHALPWSFKETDKNGNTYWTGYCVDFAKKLAEVMNFQFEFVEPKSGTFGTKKDGVWNGVVGDLAYGETDMAITALVMTADREEVVDFVAPYFEQTGITIVMRKPVRKTSLFKFMTVLKLEVWLSIVGALVVTGFMVWFLDKYSPYSARNNKKAYPYPCREFTLKESFWFALTSFTPQGGGEAPKALSGRTLVAAYWLFVVLMLATFTANLAAFLTVERMQTPVQSLEQLAKQSRINYTVVKDSDTHIYFINMKNAEDTLYRMWKELTLNASTDEKQYRVWDYPIREQYGHILLAINDSNPVANASEGFRIVNEHTDADFAFIHDSSEIKYEISRNCNLTEVGEVFAEKPYAVAVQQGSHLQDEISKAILNLQKDRFLEEIQDKWWNPSEKGSCPDTDDNEGITLESLGGVFIATLFGLALAMITLVGEVLYYRRKAKIQNMEKNTVTVKPRNEKLPITIGTEFKPVNFKDKNVSELAHVTLYPRSRNRITRIN